MALSGVFLAACGGDSDNNEFISPPAVSALGEPLTSDTDTDTGTNTTGSGHKLFNVWVLNDEELSDVLREENGQRILVNVQSVAGETIGNEQFARVETTGIPNYRLIIDQSHIDQLNERPDPGLDFTGTTPDLLPGDEVLFGEDIGYRNNNVNDTCLVDAGPGYWPPNEECPSNQDKSIWFPLDADEETAERCPTGSGAIGTAVNGVSLVSWDYAHERSAADDWHLTAGVAGRYDLDICEGHAVDGEYHHHGFSECLARQSLEFYDNHSPIYGFAADGYSIHGPMQTANVRAASCWKLRDYSAGSATGCGVEDERSCVLVDNLDPEAGTVPVSLAPSVGEAWITDSGYEITADLGMFFEDYYYDQSCQESLPRENGLDQYNGHFDDNRGYHYHMTVDEDFRPVFPYIVGPEFYGVVHSSATAQCF